MNIFIHRHKCTRAGRVIDKRAQGAITYNELVNKILSLMEYVSTK